MRGTLTIAITLISLVRPSVAQIKTSEVMVNSGQASTVEDNLIVNGKVSIGKSTSSYPLDVAGITYSEFLILKNKERANASSLGGSIYFDENYYGDFAEMTSDGGGLAIKTQDGWGAIMATNNMQWIKPRFNGASFTSYVGIGTTTPGSLMHLKQSTADGLFFERVNHDSYELMLTDSKGLSIFNSTDGRKELYFDGTGKIGVGTITPNGLFEIAQKSDPNSDEGLVISEVGNSQRIKMHLANNSTGQYGYLSLGGNTVLRGNGEDSYFDGEVGIGTLAPQSHLSVGSGHGVKVSIGNGNWQETTVLRTHWTSADGDYTELHVPGSGANSAVLRLLKSGNVEISGAVYSNVSGLSSDRRWKKDINTIISATETLNQLNPVSYFWKRSKYKEKNFDDRKHYGVIAQETEKVLPELVSTDREGFKSVEYNSLIALLVKAIQEKDKEIKSLNARVENYDQRLKSLESLLGNTSEKLDKDHSRRLSKH